MEIIEQHTVPQLETSLRLSDYLPGIFNIIYSRKGIKNAIKKGLVKVNGEIGNTGKWIKGGEIIDLYQENKTGKNTVYELPVKILFEDDYLAIVSKPAGITVNGNKKRTLEHALPFNLKKSTQRDALQSPQAIHRLDYPTSGLLLVGKTTHALLQLNQMFQNRDIEKKYLAVTYGKMTGNGIIDKPVDEKQAKTIYQVLEKIKSVRFGYLNLVEVKLITGRRHQIRKHMADIGNPVLGDAVYGIEGQILKGKGLYLQSQQLTFIHPFTGSNISIRDSVPAKVIKIFPDLDLHYFF
jgi:23S rRNA pseudouridine1911/1915/1917 synthase